MFFLPPLNREEGKQYPVVLNIKGGPGGMWGHQWFPEMQLLSARGYAGRVCQLSPVAQAMAMTKASQVRFRLRRC